MMHKVRVVARHEWALLLGSRTFRLGLLLPTAIVVGLLFYLGREMRSAAPHGRAAAPVVRAAAPDAAASSAGGDEEGHAEDAPPGAERWPANPVSVGAAYLFVLMMFVGIIVLSQYLLTNLIEEKSSRVVEVLLSAVSPFELMAGKILGLTAAGLTGIGACVAIIVLVAKLQGFIGSVNPWAISLFMVYYVLGILLVSSMYAAVGSACNTLREAQGMMLPMALVFAAPLAGWMYIVQHPGDLAVTLLSFFPPVTPMVMVMRLAVSPEVPVWQVVLSLLVLAAAVPVTMWAASKIFRTGVLMYGKPPKLREMLKWLRYK
jgi:ABC-2 type transport system permease protein